MAAPKGRAWILRPIFFPKLARRLDLWVFGKREYHSNIKGKHSYFQVRVSDKPIHSHVDEVQILATFEDSTARLHSHEVVKGGALIYDPTKITLDDLNLKSGVITLPIDFNSVIRHVAEVTGMEYGTLSLMKNTIAVAASMALLRMDMAHVEETLSRIYTGRKAKLVASQRGSFEKSL